MTEAQIYLATTITLAIVVVGAIVTIRRLHLDLDQAHTQLAARRQWCDQQHLGDLNATTEATRPAGPPPLDALVRPLGIYPTNQPYLNRRSTP